MFPAAIGLRVLHDISILASLTSPRAIHIQFGDMNRQTQTADFSEKVVLQIRLRRDFRFACVCEPMTITGTFRA